MEVNVKILAYTPTIFCIWPVPYKINLSQEETFAIFDPIDRSEMQDVYEEEEEMVGKVDMKNLNVESPNDKYYGIHQRLNNNKYNEKHKGDKLQKKTKVFEVFNPDKEYPDPFKAGFLKDEEFVNDEDTIYFEDSNEGGDTEISPQDFRKMNKRNDEKTEESYDYNKLKDEFNIELKQTVRSNKTLNYTNIKESETLKDSIKTMLKLTELKNCTEEEKKGIGLAAIKCLLSDLHKPKLSNWILDRLIRIVVIWIIIYLIIAIPLWCQYGWCCCCFTCKFCQPHKEIEEVKQFFIRNPLGIYHDPNGSVIKYQPTSYEKYAQKALEDELRKL